MGFLLMAYAHTSAVRRKNLADFQLLQITRKYDRAHKQLNEISNGIERQITQLENNAKVQAANYKNQVYQNLQAQMTDPNDQNAASQVQAQFAQFSGQVDAQLAYYTGTVLQQYKETLEAQFLYPAEEEDKHLALQKNQLEVEAELASKEVDKIDPKKEIDKIVPNFGGGN